MVAEGFWGRRDFVRKWRHLYIRDPRWTPPHLRTLRRTLNALEPTCLWVEALPKEPLYRGSSLEVPVATAAVRPDPLRQGAAYLSMLHVVNDRASLRALLETLSETLRPSGVRTLLGPTHLLPYLGGGVLSSHWHLRPPPDTPYSPPYLPEHLGALMSPESELHLHHLTTDTHITDARKEVDAAPPLTPFDPSRLAGDLLPLLRAASEGSPALSPPDEAEARALLHWLEPHKPFGLLGAVEGTPVGFVLLYWDSSRATNRFGVQKVAGQGCLLGAVLPMFRRRGVGRMLLRGALQAAAARGWEGVSVGPVSLKSEADAFLGACGAVPAQRYTLYHYVL